MKIVSPVLVLLCVALAPAFAKTLEGVDVPAAVTVSGKKLALNGAGVRVVKLGFIPIKAYVAAFYAPAPVDSAKAVAASPGPLKFTFTFLQGVGQGQVTDAWNAQFKASVSAPYPGLAKDQEKFVAMFGPLRKGGIEAVEIDGNTTRVYDGGARKGEIDGKDFQKAFLSMWFGSQPVMESLESDLLGQ
jgi:hypothetical protein